jgi:multidrug efflux pump subunit AcrA (membrane-fusion protein)
VYVVEKEAQPMGGERTVLKPVTVKLGIGDGTSVEVLEGLNEGDVVAAGTVSASATASTAPRNPFAPFGGPRR